MTTLLADLGNSRWKLAFGDHGLIHDVVSGAYDDDRAIRAAMAAHVGVVSRVLIAQVADASRVRRFLDVLNKTVNVPTRHVVSTDGMPNVISGYRRPEQLGVDRLLAMVAARAATTEPLCVVDAGTAATIDFVDGAGRHLGGFILPGVRLSRECLLANTSIPHDASVDEEASLGKDTPTAVALGARLAVAGIVERFTTGSASLFNGASVKTFVGGGDADLLCSLLPQPCIKIDNLVLKGLAVVDKGSA